MTRTIGRRAAFFAVASLVCVALVPAAPPEFRWVAWATAGLGAFWAVLLALEELIGPGRRQHSPARRATGTPFDPPPPPGEAGGQR